MIYENPSYRKIKGSHILLVSCGYCKTDIFKYQKLGRGNLLRMHIDRIIKGSVNLSKNLTCPNCNAHLGTRVKLKKDKREFYKMIRGAYNTKEVDS